VQAAASRQQLLSRTRRDISRVNPANWLRDASAQDLLERRKGTPFLSREQPLV